ncbi:MAG: ABC transporter ATP-binding protein [Hyphomonadaceae bacterium]|nr:ABC transporter ATP-binding protein [Hyphomonadaceae bacterium]
MALLELENVEANYGAVRAVRGISLSVPEGAIVALLGANGAGKSTTLKAICGAVRTHAGRIQLDGKPIANLSPNQIVKRGVALVPEGRKIFKDLTVKENLAMGAYARGDKAGIEADYRVVFDLFPRLEERQRQLGGSLSGGEQQMLAIGRGLLARPRLLLLDEPSLGLAPIIISSIFEALRKINRERGTALLVVEQNVHLALRNASFAYLLQVGRIVVEGPTEKLRADKEIVESYMGVRH